LTFDFDASGYRLFVVDTGGSHADLTATMRQSRRMMRQVAALFGKEVLRQVDPKEFYASALPWGAAGGWGPCASARDPFL
jgi:galactokinase